MGKSDKSLGLVPFGGRVLIRPLRGEETTPSGIILPDIRGHESRRGVVLAVGDGEIADGGSRVPCRVPVGATVLFYPDAGNEVRVGDGVLVLLPESAILALLE